MTVIKLFIILTFFLCFLYRLYKVVYNIYLSPLRKVPGPWLNQLFPEIMIYYILLGKGHIYVKDMHNKYGTAVRLEWNTISFSTEEASKEIYSSYLYDKAYYYDSFNVVGESIISTRNKEVHRRKKKTISPVFSDKYILNAEPLVKKNMDIFVEKMNEFSKSHDVFNLGAYLNYLTFDIIGDFAFGKSFDMIKEGKHPIIEWIKSLLSHMTFILFFPLLTHYQPKCVKQIINFANEAIEEAKKHSNGNTFLDYLTKGAISEFDGKVDGKEIVVEAIQHLIAGTDTTSNSLTWTFYLLLKHPEVYKKLKEEINLTFQDKESITYTKCKNGCDYLNAVLYESLRILPVVAGNLTRVVPKGGRVIEGYCIPEKTYVSINILAVHHSKDIYNEPHLFKPGRWLKNGKFENKYLLMSFQIGPRACIGRNLAWMELYIVLASLVRSFKFEMKDPKEIIEYENFILATPKTPLKVTVIKDD